MVQAHITHLKVVKLKKIKRTLPIVHYSNSNDLRRITNGFYTDEISNKEFSRVKNGLEPTEVANFLEQLSTEIERLKEDKKQLESNRRERY